MEGKEKGERKSGRRDSNKRERGRGLKGWRQQEGKAHEIVFQK